MLDFDRFEVLSFDCYGTLIDWEEGILGALQPVLKAHNVDLTDEQALELYAELEPEAQREGQYVEYKQVLREVMQEFGNRLGFTPSESEFDCLANSLKDWLPFPDTVPALKTLKDNSKLAVISNIDDDLFAFSARHLQVEFDWIITAEQVESYKPSLPIFEYAIKKIGYPPERMLHIAQSVYHDIIPAKAMGLSAVWVNRRKGQEDFGATRPASCDSDLEVPDLESLVSYMAFEAH
ncbi:MAG: haloacid dehalogenase type II [Dehalococcoidia bacterium]|nr:MAG: haloacid dehalogenase type II [Dehalococcoidia bacterium]